LRSRAAGRRILAGALLAAPMALTQIWFPYRYLDLLYSLEPAASWLLWARDTVLVALLMAHACPAPSGRLMRTRCERAEQAERGG
jgi:hypothetical protein